MARRDEVDAEVTRGSRNAIGGRKQEGPRRESRCFVIGRWKDGRLVVLARVEPGDWAKRLSHQTVALEITVRVRGT